MRRGSPLVLAGSNPVVIISTCGCSSIGRAPPCQGGCCGFKSRQPLEVLLKNFRKIKILGSVPERPKGAVCKTVIVRKNFVSSNLIRASHQQIMASWLSDLGNRLQPGLHRFDSDRRLNRLKKLLKVITVAQLNEPGFQEKAPRTRS